jgi:hypothetical protein
MPPDAEQFVMMIEAMGAAQRGEEAAAPSP